MKFSDIYMEISTIAKRACYVLPWQDHVPNIAEQILLLPAPSMAKIGGLAHKDIRQFAPDCH